MPQGNKGVQEMTGAVAPEALALSTALRDAQQAIQSGRLDEAGAMLQQLLVRQPDHAEVLMTAGILALQCGDAEKALAHLRNAIEKEGNNPSLHHVMGEAHVAAGDPEAAVICFDRGLALAGEMPDTLFSRGNALAELGRLEEAAESLQRAIVLSPGDAEAHLNLGNLLADIGRGDEAIRHFEHALAAEPGFLAARVSLAAHHMTSGNYTEAAALYDAILADHPNLFEALLGRGRTALRAREPAEAITYLKRAAEQLRASLPLLHDLGEAHLRLGEFEAAREILEKARRLAPDSASVLVSLGAALRECNGLAESKSCLEQALALEPDNADAYCQLGIVHQRYGNFDEAAGHLRRAISINPRHAGAFGALVADHRLIDDDDLTRHLEELVDDPDLSPEDRANLHFALGRIRDSMGRHDDAFAHFKSGNDMRDRMVGFDVDRFRGFVASIIETFDSTVFDTIGGLGNDTDRPVFVVGMPRSGTTLVEQIIAAHPAAAGAGELGAMRRVVEELGTTTPYPRGIGTLTATAANRAAEAYLAEMSAVAPEGLRVVDKMPNNYLHLGLIALLFPNAHIIHCRRDVMDMALSCYFNNFGIGVRFSYDLAKIGAYYRCYEALMEHWRRVLPVPVQEVQYEDLTADPAVHSKRLIDFIDLEWNDACLAFHENDGPVRTASMWQVRQPVYRSSIGRWRNYEKHLEPLRRALGEENPFTVSRPAVDGAAE